MRISPKDNEHFPNVNTYLFYSLQKHTHTEVVHFSTYLFLPISKHPELSLWTHDFERM